jgi:hypothetical protein
MAPRKRPRELLYLIGLLVSVTFVEFVGTGAKVLDAFERLMEPPALAAAVTDGGSHQGEQRLSISLVTPLPVEASSAAGGRHCCPSGGVLGSI